MWRGLKTSSFSSSLMISSIISLNIKRFSSFSFIKSSFFTFFSLKRRYFNKLSQIREEMKREDVDCYLIPQIDPHGSEYFASCYERMKYLSNFTGSSGIIVITLNNAYLWTDGR